MEIFYEKGTQFLQLLSTMQDVCHPSTGEAHATEVEPPVLAPAPPHGTSEDAPLVKKEDATPVEEDPTPLGDPTLGATSMDAWPHYSPTTGFAQVSLLFCSVGGSYNYCFAS